jgi:hypothetical protein
VARIHCRARISTNHWQKDFGRQNCDTFLVQTSRPAHETQLKSMVTAEQLEGHQRVDITIGGDHGGGEF